MLRLSRCICLFWVIFKYTLLAYPLSDTFLSILLRPSNRFQLLAVKWRQWSVHKANQPFLLALHDFLGLGLVLRFCIDFFPGNTTGLFSAGLIQTMSASCLWGNDLVSAQWLSQGDCFLVSLSILMTIKLIVFDLIEKVFWVEEACWLRWSFLKGVLIVKHEGRNRTFLVVRVKRVWIWAWF